MVLAVRLMTIAESMIPSMDWRGTEGEREKTEGEREKTEGERERKAVPSSAQIFLDFYAI